MNIEQISILHKYFFNHAKIYMRLTLVLLTVIVCTACTSLVPDYLVGQNRGVVINALGPPYAEAKEGDFSILIYPNGPIGKGTYFIYLDQFGAVTRWEDVLTYQNFEKITLGMQSNEVEKIIGPSLTKWGVRKERQTIWNYPFHNSMCQMFQIAVLPNGVVAEIGFGYATECEGFGE